MNKGYFYIIESIKRVDKIYTGSTVNLNNRLNDHNNGNTRSTKNYRPWKIKYFEEYNTLSEARRREKQIKKWKNRCRIEALIKRNNKGC